MPTDMKVRLYVVGGFLGSGKTTALTSLADYFTQQGLRAAMITNDQTDGLVDSEIVRTQGIAYREISGACFCTRFNDFLETADTLFQDIQPNVILAEPVGSAADLIATVVKPLRVYAGERYEVMPLTVLADPNRVGEMFFEESGKDAVSSWPEDIRYLYERQIREADYLLLTKADVVSERDMQSAVQTLQKQYGTYNPHLKIQPFSAVTRQGMDEWLKGLDECETDLEKESPSFDRDRHARAEHALGWLNLETTLIHSNPSETDIDAVALVQGFLQRLKDRLHSAPVGHLKVFAQTKNDAVKASIVDWRLGYTLEKIEKVGLALKPGRLRPVARPTLLQDLDTVGLASARPTLQGNPRVLVNIRAIRDPNELREQALEALREAALLQQVRVEVIKDKALRPGKPQPTYHIGDIG